MPESDLIPGSSSGKIRELYPASHREHNEFFSFCRDVGASYCEMDDEFYVIKMVSLMYGSKGGMTQQRMETMTPLELDIYSDNFEKLYKSMREASENRESFSTGDDAATEE